MITVEKDPAALDFLTRFKASVLQEAGSGRGARVKESNLAAEWSENEFHRGQTVGEGSWLKYVAKKRLARARL